ncbi:MgtC/SapB family protein [Sphingomonas panaciterrae]|uniref:MgtC/SapB family protein n=1 Tax=Sphingomonas panaciterrae TaxID=1462999 RepID=UPI002FF071A0
MTEGDWTTIGIRLLLATAIGLALGFEREWRGHDAGLRTHALVALSAATITVSALLLADDAHGRDTDSDPLRVVQGLAQAIGFIAGGLIFVRGGDVRNMTTAASLWMAAAVGITAGAGQLALVVLSSAIALLLLTGVGLAERLLPKRDHRPAPPEDIQLPNRRGMLASDGTDESGKTKT